MGIVINLDDRRPKETSITDTDLIDLWIATESTQKKVEEIRKQFGIYEGYSYISKLIQVVLRWKNIFPKNTPINYTNLPYIYHIHLKKNSPEEFEDLRNQINEALRKKLPIHAQKQLFILRTAIMNKQLE